MTRLRVLHPEGRRLVVPELASGERERWEEPAYRALLRDPERAIELGPFDQVLDRAIKGYPPFQSALDGGIAADLHRALRLTRREAAEPGFWRFLAIVPQPEFVRHRWENRSWATMRSRFWRPGTRLDSNAIGRLWWIAELTRQGEDYSLTKRVFSRHSIIANLFTRDLCAHRPAVEAFVEVFETERAEIIEAAIRAFNHSLSTIVLETRGVRDLIASLEEIRGRVELSLAAEVGG